MNTTATQRAPAIELLEVGKSYGKTAVLSGINLAIAPGEFIALLGPSGCGKSTLLKLIAGLEELSDGEIYVGGRLANYLKPSDRDVAMVFQNYALYPHMTVRENLGFPLKMSGVAREEVRAKVESAAALLQLGEQLERYPDELSGGQRQRVALGRAIVRQPLAFLMDEPLSNLDALLRVEMRTELVRLHKRVGRTTIYVTHDQVEAMTMANRIVLLHKGLIQQVGTPAEVYAAPANMFVATFVGSPPMNLIAGRIESSGGQRLFRGPFDLALDGLAPAALGDGPATLGIRPEQVALVGAGEPQALPASVELVERVGPDSFVLAHLADGAALNIRVDAATPIREGDHVFVRLPPARLRLFDAAGMAVARERA
ncbi:MAG TPA: sn-glycerol-3-phosphate ABC transporter ATP-binding protein UgpC [Candidatus Acidoferrum sp.]|nr:sn-glycerol-3-phosphate ABC transporter ATP-binding protein UgpC [Candidatus Acidoferrum sp.]